MEELANNPAGEGTTPTEQPTVEPTTESPSEPVREDLNPSSGKPETVPYGTFAETRRELREAKGLLAQLQNAFPDPQTTGQPQIPSSGGVPKEYVLEDGSINIDGYTSWMKSQIPDPKAISSQVVEELERRDNVRQWRQKEESDLSTKYPQVKEMPQARELIEAIKERALVKGDYKTLSQAAEEFFNIQKTIAETARREVQETREVQANLSAPPTSAKVDAGDMEEARLYQLMQSDDEGTRSAARREWLKRKL